MTWWEKKITKYNKRKRVKKISNKYTKQERNNLKKFLQAQITPNTRKDGSFSCLKRLKDVNSI